MKERHGCGSIFLGIISVVAILIVTIGISFAIGVIDLEFMKFFGIRRENIRREIYEENVSYVRGMTKDLSEYHLQWMLAEDDVEKSAIVNVVRQRYAEFDISHLTDNPQLYNFLTDIRNGSIK